TRCYRDWSSDVCSSDLLGEVSILVPPIMCLALIAGLGFVAIMVPAQTFLQERAPVELRGRVFAVQLMLSNFASIVPLLLLGGLEIGRAACRGEGSTGDV